MTAPDIQEITVPDTVEELLGDEATFARRALGRARLERSR